MAGASARFLGDFVVHTSGDSGSPAPGDGGTRPRHVTSCDKRRSSERAAGAGKTGSGTSGSPDGFGTVPARPGPAGAVGVARRLGSRRPGGQDRTGWW